MWYIIHFIFRDLIRDDWKTLIELHGISVDDLAVVFAR
jgi:hypothetical protein